MSSLDEGAYTALRCVGCATSFLPTINKDGSIRKGHSEHCTDKCRRSDNARKAGAFSWKVERACEMCGAAYMPERQAAMYCCNECRASAQRATSASRRAMSAMSAVKKPKPESKWLFSCEMCGKQKLAQPNGKDMRNPKYKPRWCSYACRSAASSLYKVSKYYTAVCKCGVPMGGRKPLASMCGPCRLDHDRARAVEYARSNKKYTDGVRCADCDVPFCRINGYKSSRCHPCSVVHTNNMRSANRKARKAAQRSATVELVIANVVFERDGWRCYICGCSTPKEFRGTYRADAPELEHVVPLSKGGAHSYANTRCACRACNIAKSDKYAEAA